VAAMTDRNAEAHRHGVEKMFPRLGETATTDKVLNRQVRSMMSYCAYRKLDSYCVPGTTLQVDFNFSSTYSESSIMGSATCSAGRPAKFLSTNSLT